MRTQDNHLSALPRGWVWIRLDQILDKFESGGRPKGGSKNIQSGIPSIGGEHLTNDGRFNFTNVRYVPLDFFTKMSKGEVKKGDALIVKDGATTGKVSFVREDFPFDKAAVNEHVFLARPLQDIDQLWVFYYMFSLDGQDCVRKSLRGTAQGGITKSFFVDTFLPLSPLPEQHRIVDKIEELFAQLDAGVEALKKTQIQLRHFRQSVLKSAFKGELTVKWRKHHKGNLEPASTLLEKIKEDRKTSSNYKELPQPDTTDLSEIPQEWKWARLVDFIESMKNGIYRPPQFYGTYGVACLRMYNIENGKIVWKDIKRMNLTHDEINEYGLLEGDILVNRVNSRELVGKAAPIPNGLEPCVYESKNIRVRLHAKYVVSKYVSYWLQLSGQTYFNHNAQQTVGMASINQEQLSSIPVPFCPLIEQNKITEEIERYFSVADEIETTLMKNLKQSDRLRQSILKRAFEGKLVTQNPADEPAEKLLQRINKLEDKSSKGITHVR